MVTIALKVTFFMRRIILLPILLLMLFTARSGAQTITIDRVEPMNWWVGMNDPQLQILVYGKDIALSHVSIDYPGVRLEQSVRTTNPNYVFVNLRLDASVKPGTMPIVFRNGRRTVTHNYPLLERSQSTMRNNGFDASDVIYLLMPDRFANGDVSNDAIPGMLEAADRSQPFARHGGDLKGLSDRLDYLQDLGMTAIWVAPIFENDMPPNYAIGAGFYHGYAATDMYKVDRRLGSNEEFRELVSRAQSKGLKVIMDMIHNHVGTHHWMMKDLPTADWVHDQKEVGNTNYRTSTIMDPYASERDLNSTIKGWFVDEMPDLDQRNPLLAKYLIQNTLWWIEYSGIDGIRMDTHPYPYKEYMAEWTRTVLNEYPRFNIVGEAWMPNVATTAWWQSGFPDKNGYDSYLRSVTDFPLYYALGQAFHESGGWDTGLARLYYTLSQDFLYTDPFENVIFLDNHDLSRYFTSQGEDVAKFKLGLTFVLTTRGIPQIYYGTEIAMKGGTTDPDKRRNFPGGWPGDPIDAFTAEGRQTLGVSDVFEHMRTLTRWRRDNPVIHEGALTHFVPVDNVYVYFRHTDQQTVMVIMNGDDKEKSLRTARFSERMNGFSSGVDVLTSEVFSDLSTLTVPAKGSRVIELRR
jgi:neopullulanase